MLTFTNKNRNPSDKMDYDAWARKIRDQNNSFGNPRDAKFVGAWTRYFDRDHNSQAEIISKYRQEMLELVRGMPEPAYELSLKDIVESPKIITPLEETEEVCKLDEEEDEEKKDTVKKAKKRVLRSKSMDVRGVQLLNKFIRRIYRVLGRKKRHANSAGTGTRDSPKPVLESVNGGARSSAAATPITTVEAEAGN